MASAQPTRLQVTSPAVRDGHIPSEFTCDGRNQVLPLQWSGAAAQTRSFALLVDDPDAPRADFVHWLLWNVPGEARELRGAPGGAVQGRNGFGEIGWGGPCPPRGHGEHRYVFHLFALDDRLHLAEGAQRDELMAAIGHHVLASGEFTATYRRQGKA
jgi:Raf kinase inhibitor-like YbhB/YbcL family protein